MNDQQPTTHDLSPATEVLLLHEYHLDVARKANRAGYSKIGAYMQGYADGLRRAVNIFTEDCFEEPDEDQL